MDDPTMTDPVEMAPEADNDQDAYISTLEEIITSTEGCDYGGGAWLDLYGMVSGHKVKINLTSHAKTPEGALRNLMGTVDVAIKEFNLKPFDPTLTVAAPATTPAARAAAPAAPGVPAAPARAAAPALPAAAPAAAAAAAAPSAAGGFFVIERIEVLPRSDGKTEVKFWGAGRKYADLVSVRLPAQHAEQLSAATGAAWTAAHFEKGCAYQVPLKVYWVPSTRMNSAGQPYKNIERIEAA